MNREKVNWRNKERVNIEENGASMESKTTQRSSKGTPVEKYRKGVENGSVEYTDLGAI
jgi:hypothetical protein